ncbi:MAG: glycosyltransferase family 4 protein [Caldilineaceae bacterium]
MRRRVGFVQRVLAEYRKPFFEALAVQPEWLVNVCAGQPLRGETLRVADTLSAATLTPLANTYWQGARPWICWQRGLSQWLGAVDPEVLILEANPRLLSNWQCIHWMHHRGRRVLGWGLGSMPRSGGKWENTARALLFAQLVRSFDGVIAYSSKAKKDYINCGLRPEQVFIAYNSVDNSEAERYLHQLGSDASWIPSWKTSIGLEPNLPTILFVGRLIERKRVDLLLEACAGLLHRCQVLIVGEGPAVPALKTQASRYAGNIRFPGHLAGAVLARCMLAADVFVLPGSGGLAMQQAMSYGKPIVVSFGDGTEGDLVRDGVNGRYFTAGDAASLHEVLSELLDDPLHTVEMGQASLKIIREEINLARMVKSFGDAIGDRTFVDNAK